MNIANYMGFKGGNLVALAYVARTPTLVWVRGYAIS